MPNALAAFYSEHLPLFVGSVFILGLVIGSFLNVVIYRLPIILDREWRAQAEEIHPVAAGTIAAPSPPDRFSLSVPRSACPVCKAPIRAWQNIPVISWLVLRARCAACGTHISARYPLVELASGVLSAGVAWHFGFGPPAACALLVTWTLIALTGIDLDHQLLPDNLTLPLMWAGLVAAVAIGPPLGQSLPVVPARCHHRCCRRAIVSLWLVFHAFRLVTGKEGMGYGDFKLVGCPGCLAGMEAACPLVIFLSAATGAVLGISDDRPARARSRGSHALRTLPRRRGLACHDVWEYAGRGLSCACRACSASPCHPACASG